VAAPSPEMTARNLRASAERCQDCAANEAAGSASDEGAGATRWHCQSSYHLLDLKLPWQDLKEDWHGCLGAGFV